MFTEELAYKIGIAYGTYKALCSTTGKEPMKASDFVELCTSSIDEILDIKGFSTDN